MSTEPTATVPAFRPRPSQVPIAPEPVSEELVETVAGLLIRLRDLGRDTAARGSLVLVPDPELVLNGQRVEHIASRLFVAIFATEAPQ